MTSWLDQCSSPCALNENLLYQPSPTLNQLLFLWLDDFVFLMYSSSFVVGGCEYFFLLGRWGWLDRIWIQQLQCIYSLGSVGIFFHSVIPLGTNSKPFNGWAPLELLEMLEHSRARTFNLVLGCFNVPLFVFYGSYAAWAISLLLWVFYFIGRPSFLLPVYSIDIFCKLKCLYFSFISGGMIFQNWFFV